MVGTPAQRMRNLLKLFEADVINFPGPKKDKSAQGQVPDHLKYAAAVDKQQRDSGKEPEPKNLEDLARPIILKNLDKVFSGETLPDEDREELALILRANNDILRMKRQHLITKVRELYKENNPGIQVNTYHPDPRQAYLNDDPVLAKHRIVIQTKGSPKNVVTFDNVEEMDHYILTKMLPDISSWSQEDKDELAATIKSILGTLEHLEIYYTKDPSKTFDPDKRPKKFWSEEDDENELKPSIQKYLDALKDFDNEENWFNISYNTGSTWSGDSGIWIEFASAHQRSKRITFKTIDELEHYVVSHKADIDKWVNDQKNGIKPDEMELIKEIVSEIIACWKEILSGKYDADEMKKKGWHIHDNVSRLKHEKLKNMFGNLVFDIMAPNMHKFIEPHYLEWLPQQVEYFLEEQ